MATYTASSTTGVAVTHVNGVPPCGSKLNDTTAANDAQPLSGGLFGGATLISVGSGTDYTQDPVALDNFYTIGANYQNAGAVLPDLTQANPPVSRVVAPNSNVYTSTWTLSSADPVSAVLMHNTVLNEYVLDANTKSGTDWVVTMPTKRYYVKKGTGNASPPFQRNFNTTAGACDDVSLAIYDREERTQSSPLNFSPPPPTATASICWEANVITFNNSNVLGSTNLANIPVPGGFQNGWLNLGFPTGISGAATDVHRMVNLGATSITTIGGGTSTGNTTTYVGLPVVGFAVQSFTNGTLQVGTPPVSVLSNYGGNFKHKNNTLIQ